MLEGWLLFWSGFGRGGEVLLGFGMAYLLFSVLGQVGASIVKAIAAHVHPFIGRVATRLMVSIVILPVMLVTAVVWALLGLLSMKKLGTALKKTGDNLEAYHW